MVHEIACQPPSHAVVRCNAFSDSSINHDALTLTCHNARLVLGVSAHNVLVAPSHAVVSWNASAAASYRLKFSGTSTSMSVPVHQPP